MFKPNDISKQGVFIQQTYIFLLPVVVDSLQRGGGWGCRSPGHLSPAIVYPTATSSTAAAPLFAQVLIYSHRSSAVLWVSNYLSMFLFRYVYHHSYLSRAHIRTVTNYSHWDKNKPLLYKLIANGNNLFEVTVCALAAGYMML